LIKSYKVINN